MKVFPQETLKLLVVIIQLHSRYLTGHFFGILNDWMKYTRAVSYNV